MTLRFDSLWKTGLWIGWVWLTFETLDDPDAVKATALLNSMIAFGAVPFAMFLLRNQR